MYVPPIHVDLVHFQGTWGTPVPYLHVDQNMSTCHPSACFLTTFPCRSEYIQPVHQISPIVGYNNSWKFYISSYVFLISLNLSATPIHQLWLNVGPASHVTGLVSCPVLAFVVTGHGESYPSPGVSFGHGK